MMNVTTTLTETGVKDFVINWYRQLDVHAPLTDLLPRLIPEGLVMRLPETTLHGIPDFIKWYEGVTHRFFDEAHEMKELHVHISDNQAEVNLIVNWQAHIWNAPAPNSQWIGFDATQSWIVKVSPETNQMIVTTYNVDKFVPMPGSPDL